MSSGSKPQYLKLIESLDKHQIEVLYNLNDSEIQVELHIESVSWSGYTNISIDLTCESHHSLSTIQDEIRLLLFVVETPDYISGGYYEYVKLDNLIDMLNGEDEDDE